MSARVLANISPESNCSAVSVLVYFLHSFIVRTLFLRGWWNPSGQLHCNKKKCAMHTKYCILRFSHLEHLIWRKAPPSFWCVLHQIGCAFTPSQCAFPLTSVVFPTPSSVFHTNSLCFPTNFSVYSHSL